MEPMLHAMTQVSAVTAGALINAIAVGILLAALIEMGLHLLPRMRPAHRFVVWGSVLLAAIGLHFVPLRSSAGMAAGERIAFHADSRWALAILLLWGSITIIRLIRLAQSAWHLRRIAAAAEPVVAVECAALLQQGRRHAGIYLSADVDRPSVVGFVRPRILIPASIYPKLSAKELEQIVLHEMEHIRRADDWTNLIQKIVLALFPLNPAVGWVERRLCRERELACDDCVLHATASHKTYAYCLTNLAEQSLLQRNISLALGAWGRRSELADRVHRILYDSKRSYGTGAGAAVAGVLVAGLMGGALTLSQVPMLVNFSTPVSIDAKAISVPTAYAVEAVASSTSVAETSQRQPAPVLVKAVMSRSRREAFYPADGAHPAVKSRKKIASRKVSPGAPNLLVRTDWRHASELPHIVLAVDEQTGSSYAAVPLRDGWLVIQL